MACAPTSGLPGNPAIQPVVRWQPDDTAPILEAIHEVSTIFRGPTVNSLYLVSAIPDPNRLDIHKFANTEFPKFTAIPGIFDSTKWKSWIGSNHAVDENTPRLYFINEPFFFSGLIGPRGRTESKCGCVCPLIASSMFLTRRALQPCPNTSSC